MINKMCAWQHEVTSEQCWREKRCRICCMDQSHFNQLTVQKYKKTPHIFQICLYFQAHRSLYRGNGSACWRWKGKIREKWKGLGVDLDQCIYAHDCKKRDRLNRRHKVIYPFRRSDGERKGCLLERGTEQEVLSYICFLLPIYLPNMR